MKPECRCCGGVKAWRSTIVGGKGVKCQSKDVADLPCLELLPRRQVELLAVQRNGNRAAINNAQADAVWVDHGLGYRVDARRNALGLQLEA